MPTESIGSNTGGSTGSRSATGGSSPAATSSASIGASEYSPLATAAMVDDSADPLSDSPPAKAPALTIRSASPMANNLYMGVSL